MMGTLVLHILFTAANAFLWFQAGRAWERRKRNMPEHDKTEELLNRLRKHHGIQTPDAPRHDYHPSGRRGYQNRHFHANNKEEE